MTGIDGGRGPEMAGTAVASRAVRTLRWPALGAVATMLASGGLVLLGAGDPYAWAAVAGYLLGAVVVTVLVQVHRAARNKASASPWYNPEPRLDRIAGAAMTLGLLCGAWHAFVLATELAK
jgi:hypothetical protein